jgi:hypothetical protein
MGIEIACRTVFGSFPALFHCGADPCLVERELIEPDMRELHDFKAINRVCLEFDDDPLIWQAIPEGNRQQLLG